jgi:hypothetical protein
VTTAPPIGPADAVACPQDGLAFRPYFTDGACPLCGWRPEAPVARPWTHRVDWVWITFGAWVAVAVVMAIVVLARL